MVGYLIVPSGKNRTESDKNRTKSDMTTLVQQKLIVKHGAGAGTNYSL